MSEPKLSADKKEAARIRGVLLEKAKTITGQIKMSHLLEKDEKEFIDFVKKLKDLEDAYFLKGYEIKKEPTKEGVNHKVDTQEPEKVPTKKEADNKISLQTSRVLAKEAANHRADIAQVVYNNGTYQVLRNVVKSRLRARNYVTQVEDDTMTTHMYTLVRALVNYSHSEDAKEAMTKDSDFLSAILHTLEAGHIAHINKNLSEKQDRILVACIRILTSCACVEKAIPSLRRVGTVKVLIPYLDSHDGSIKLSSLTTLAKLVNEKEAKDLLINNVNIFFLLIRRLNKAWESSEHREEWGGTVQGLSRTLREIARNDTNKRVLVDKGCLPVLVSILKSADNFEVAESLEALWLLSFDGDNKLKMVEEPDLVRRVWGKYINTSPSDKKSDPSSAGEYGDKIKRSTYGILLSLSDQLKEKTETPEFIDIATKIGETKADLRSTQGSQQQVVSSQMGQNISTGTKEVQGQHASNGLKKTSESEPASLGGKLIEKETQTEAASKPVIQTDRQTGEERGQDSV